MIIVVIGRLMVKSNPPQQLKASPRSPEKVSSGASPDHDYWMIGKAKIGIVDPKWFFISVVSVSQSPYLSNLDDLIKRFL